MLQKLLAAGIVILLAGFCLLVVGAAGEGNASAGGVVFIGPFPIVFGSGPDGVTLAALSVIIGGVMLVLLLLWSRRLLRAEAA